MLRWTSHQVGRDWPVDRNRLDPAISLHRGTRLPLRSGTQFLGRYIGPNRLIELSLGELRALDSAGPGDLALQLQFLQRLNPAFLIRQRGEGLHRRLGLDKSRHDSGCVVENPAFWQLIANHMIS